MRSLFSFLKRGAVPAKMLRCLHLLLLLALLSGCASVPSAYDVNLDEWEERSVDFSGTTLTFEAPKEVFPSRDIVFHDSIDVYDDAKYNDFGSNPSCMRLGWSFMPKRNVQGEFFFWIVLNKYAVDTTRNMSLSEMMDNKTKLYRLKKNLGESIPYRYKYTARFSENGPDWLVSDHKHSGVMQDSVELFTYPLDNTHTMSMGFQFLNNTYSPPKDPKRYLLWYNEAEAVADRILASVRIERTTPFPDVEYGAVDIGYVHPSRIPYVDKFSERPPISRGAKD